MAYKVEKNVLVATLQYLQTRPYSEVNELIRAISQSEEIVETPVEEDKPKKK